MKMLAREKILTSVTVLLVIVLAGITVTYATPMSLSMDALRGGYHIEEGISTDGKIFMPIGDAVPPRSLEVMKQKWGLPIPSLPIGRYNGDVEDISKIGFCISTNDNATHGETLTTNVSVMFECNSNITVEIVPIGIDELNKWANLTYSDLPFIPYTSNYQSNEIKPEWVSVDPERIEVGPGVRAANFTISVIIPENANTGGYGGVFLIKTDKEPDSAIPYCYGYPDPEFEDGGVSYVEVTQINGISSGIQVGHFNPDFTKSGETLNVPVFVFNWFSSENMKVEIIPIEVGEWANYSDEPFIPCRGNQSRSNEIKPEWVSVKPERAELEPRGYGIFIISVAIPKDAVEGCYDGAFLLKTDKREYSKKPYSYTFLDPGAEPPLPSESALALIISMWGGEAIPGETTTIKGVFWPLGNVGTVTADLVPILEAQSFDFIHNPIDPEWVSVSPNKTILDTSGAEAVEFAISVSIPKDINPGDYEGQIAVRTENMPDVIFSYGVDVSKARKGPLIWGPKLAHREMVDTHPKFQRKIVSSNPGMSRIPRNVDASRYALKSVPRVYKNPTSGRGTRQINTTRDYMIKTKREIPNIPIRSRFDGVGIGVSYSSNDEATLGETLTVNVSVENGCDSSNMTVEIIPIAVDEWDNYSDSTPFIPCSCTLSFSNEINPEWVSVEPGKVELTPEERANYTISVIIPENANTGCYEGAFLIRTNKEPFLAMPYSYGFSDPEYNREFIPPPPPVAPDGVRFMMYGIGDKIVAPGETTTLDGFMQISFESENTSEPWIEKPEEGHNKISLEPVLTLDEGSYNHSKWIDPEWVSGNIEKINVTNYEWDLDLVISVCVPADLEPGYYIGQIDVRQDNNSVVVFSYGLRVSEIQKESVTGAQKPVIPHEGAVVPPEPSMNMESPNAGIRSIAKNADASAFKPKPVSVRGVKEPVKVHRYEKPKMTCKAENPESGREVLQKNPKKVRQPTTRVQRIR